jgi:hypothetical protein
MISCGSQTRVTSKKHTSSLHIKVSSAGEIEDATYFLFFTMAFRAMIAMM